MAGETVDGDDDVNAGTSAVVPEALRALVLLVAVVLIVVFLAKNTANSPTRISRSARPPRETLVSSRIAGEIDCYREQTRSRSDRERLTSSFIN